MPEAPSVPQHYRDAIRSLHNDWDIMWRPEVQRFAVVKRGWFKGRPQQLVLTVCQDDDGSFRPVDQRLIDYVQRRVYVERNGDPEADAVKRDAAIEQSGRKESQNDLEALRDEAETRVRLATWTGRKR